MLATVQHNQLAVQYRDAMIKSATPLLKASLAAIHYSGIGTALSGAARGAGALLMLHHVRPRAPEGFAPNRILEITPEFLETAIVEVRRAGFDTVSLDEAHARMTGAQKATRPFVCFTFDDGYRDNRDYAMPVLKRHNVPLTVYAAADFADGKGFLWWIVLERVVAQRQFISLDIGGTTETFRCTSVREKSAAFDRIYWRLRTMSELDARSIVARLADESGIDRLGPCRDLVMSWDELRDFASDPLVTIGAHTMGHYALAKLGANEALAEITGSIARVEQELGRPCRHFCYPYGDQASAGEREFEITSRLGMKTAVTTRKGLIRQDHASRLTALPRLSLNGDYQRAIYLKALLSGVPFAMLDTLRRPPAELPAYLPAGASGFCIQRTSHAAGTTQASPPTI